MNTDVIRHELDISRSRWYGWEWLNSSSGVEYNDYTYASTVDSYCGGKGTYTYQVIGRGQINFSGQTWNAEAYDESRYTC
jgi:hypothetical protein